jgi:hypothetical protein
MLQRADRTAVISLTLCDTIPKPPKRGVQMSMDEKRELAFSSDLLAFTVAWTLGIWKALSVAVGPTRPMIRKYVNEQKWQPMPTEPQPIESGRSTTIAALRALQSDGSRRNGSTSETCR